MKNSKFSIAVVSVLVIVGGGYYFWKSKKGESNEFVAGQTLGAKPDAKNKPVFVNTTVAKKRNYDVKLNANGVVTSLNVVDVRSQVSSIIEKVHIKEGQFVRAGDVLFTLDSRADSVNLAKAQAQLDKEMATLAENQRQLVRAKELFEKKFQSQSAVDAANTIVQAQKSVVDGAKAAVAAAKVSLGFTRIVAPVSGRTGIINVFPGSLVQPSVSGSPLVTITQMDPIAVAFPLPQRNLSDALDSLKRGDSVAYASLPDTKQQYKGKLQFIDNVVDATSGTVKAKAVFENKEMKLWPGAFANVELGVVTLKDVIVIPQDAIVIGVNSNSVFVVDAEGKAAQKKVDVKYTFGLDAVVTGIDEGTKIVLEGKQNLRPGTPIKERTDDAGEAKGKKGGKKDASESSSAVASPASSPEATNKAGGASASAAVSAASAS